MTEKEWNYGWTLNTIRELVEYCDSDHPAVLKARFELIGKTARECLEKNGDLGSTSEI